MGNKGNDLNDQMTVDKFFQVFSRVNMFVCKIYVDRIFNSNFILFNIQLDPGTFLKP